MSERISIPKLETSRNALPALLRLARAADTYADALAAGVEIDRQVALWADVESARAAFDFGGKEPAR
jgi:hypothetical protein